MSEKTLKEKVVRARNILYKMSKHVGEGWIGELDESLTALEERVEELEKERRAMRDSRKEAPE